MRREDCEKTRREVEIDHVIVELSNHCVINLEWELIWIYAIKGRKKGAI